MKYKISLITLLLILSTSYAEPPAIHPFLKGAIESYMSSNKIDIPATSHITSLKMLSTSKSLMLKPKLKEAYEIMVCEKNSSKGIRFEERNCSLSINKVDIATLINIYRSNKTISISTLKHYKPLMSKALPFIVGKIYYNNSFPHLNLTTNNISITGENVRVAIIDTGINDSNPWFKDAKIIYKARAFYDRTLGACSYDNSSYQDVQGHGTHVASILHSTAPAAELIILNVFGSSPSTNDADVICGIEKALELNASIISLSLGSFANFTDCTLEGDVLCAYIEDKAKRNNALFSIAAGNEGGWYWHYTNWKKERKVNISYLKFSTTNTYFFIRWYDVSTPIEYIEIYTLSDTLIANITYNNGNYVIAYNNTPIYGNYGCTSNQCGIYLNIISLEDNYILVHSNVEWDLYDIYFLYDPYTTTISPSNSSRTISSPGIAEHAFTIGSITSYIYSNPTNPEIGNISYFSSRGNVKINESYSIIKPTLLAPGREIVGGWWNTINYTAQGTSMATPLFSGILALIKEVLPSITYEEIMDNITHLISPDAYKIKDLSIYDKGYGLINLSNVAKAIPYIEANTSIYELTIPQNNQTIAYNISLKGVLRAIVEGKKYHPPQKIEVVESINTSLLRAGNYTFNTTIEGEFLGAPYIYFYTIIATSNISVENISISHINETHINTSLTLKNRGFTTSCVINTTYAVINQTITYNTTKNVVLYSIPIKPKINISIICPNNLGTKNITIYTIGKINMDIHYTNILSNITLNIITYENYTKITQYYLDIDGRIYNISSLNITQYVIDPFDFLLNNTYNYTLNLMAEINNTFNITIYTKKINLKNPFNITITSNINNSFWGMNTTANITIYYENISNDFTLIAELGNTTIKKYINTSNGTIRYENITHLNLTNIYSDIIKATIKINAYRNNKSITLLNQPIIIDNKPPSINLNESYNINSILIPITLNEKNIKYVEIYYNNTLLKNISSNDTLIQINECINTSIKVDIQDKASNRANKKINVSCYRITNPYFENYVESIFSLNKTLPINITSASKEYSKKALGNTIIETINESLTIMPIANTTSLIKLRFSLPEGYKLKEALKYNGTTNNITKLIEINASNSYVYLLLNISIDPTISLIYEKISKILSTTTPKGSGGGGGSYITKETKEDQQLYNITIILPNKTKREILLNTTQTNISVELEDIMLALSLYTTSKNSKISIYKEENTYIITLENITITLNNITIKSLDKYVLCKYDSISMCKLPITVNRTISLIINEIKRDIKPINNKTPSTNINKTLTKTTNNHKNDENKIYSLYLIIVGLIAILLSYTIIHKKKK